GTDLDLDALTELLATYDVELWQTRDVASRDEAIAAGEALGWDVVLKATAEHLRERPDQAHVWRNIDDADEMADAWDTLGNLIGEPERAGFVVQKNAPPGVPVAVRTIEDPLFGPVVSFGIAGPLTELLADRSYRIPPLGGRDAASMVREIKSSPMLFGYRGSEAVDVAEVERLIQRVAQLQNDVPQVSALELSLVLAGADRATVLTAAARVDPVVDPRSDWFVRRLSQPAGDTLPS
ncbi:acetate--CoA ligase family protein, partial [Nocardioides hankookensis]